MKAITLLALLIWPLLVPAQEVATNSSESDKEAYKAPETWLEEVKNDFERYRTATLEDRGEDAIQCLDGRVFDYYQVMLEHARKSDSATVASLPLADQLLVLAIRHRATPEQVMAFTDSTCLIFALDEGMIDKEGAANIQIDDVDIDGDFAQATVSSMGEQVPLKFHFYKSDGIWKFDLTQLFPLANEILAGIVTDSGMAPGELVTLLIGMAAGEPVDETSIWQPVEQ